MADNHYVDPKDQHTVAEGVEDHSYLTTFYAEAKKEELGPWMQEADRQKALEAERFQIIFSLRKSAISAGIFTSTPVVFGIIVWQFLTFAITPANGMIVLLLILFGLGGYVLVTYLCLKWVVETFHKHALRAFPIAATTLASLVLLIIPLFNHVGNLIGDMIGNIVVLVSLLLIGTIITTISIFIWTSQKIHGIAKMGILLAFIGASAAVMHLL